MNHNDHDDVLTVDADELKMIEAEVRKYSGLEHRPDAKTSLVNLIRSASAQHAEGVASNPAILGSQFARDLLSVIETATKSTHVAEVIATTPYWHDGVGLSPGSRWRVTPSTFSEWQAGGGKCSYGTGIPSYSVHASETPPNSPETDEQGQPCRTGSRRWRVHLGYVYVLVWHHQQDGSARGEVRPLFADGRTFAVGPFGGSMHFIIQDLKGAYRDNAGHCIVNVDKA